MGGDNRNNTPSKKESLTLQAHSSETQKGERIRPFRWFYVAAFTGLHFKQERLVLSIDVRRMLGLCDKNMWHLFLTSFTEIKKKGGGQP